MTYLGESINCMWYGNGVIESVHSGPDGTVTHTEVDLVRYEVTSTKWVPGKPVTVTKDMTRGQEA